MLRFDRKQQNSVKKLPFNKKINFKKVQGEIWVGGAGGESCYHGILYSGKKHMSENKS